MVKRSRDQSGEVPRRRICLVMVLPEYSFHSHTFSMNFSRPRSWREMPCASSWRSTTICVAMPAWSVPGCHSVLSPAHAVVARERIHQRLVETVPHVQRAGDVGRRQLDAEILFLGGVESGLEVAGVLPGGIPAGFDVFRVKTFCEFHLSSFCEA